MSAINVAISDIVLELEDFEAEVIAEMWNACQDKTYVYFSHSHQCYVSEDQHNKAKDLLLASLKHHNSPVRLREIAEWLRDNEFSEWRHLFDFDSEHV